jgi:hypothetical protein
VRPIPVARVAVVREAIITAGQRTIHGPMPDIGALDHAIVASDGRHVSLKEQGAMSDVTRS